MVRSRIVRARLVSATVDPDRQHPGVFRAGHIRPERVTYIGRLLDRDACTSRRLGEDLDRRLPSADLA